MWTPDPSIIISAEQRDAEAITAAWVTLRTERDQRIAGTDYTQLPDAPVDTAAWAVYRRALRDLPENTIDPNNPVWPLPPDMNAASN